MDIRSEKLGNILENLEKKEKQRLALRDAIQRSKARLDASQNALRTVKTPVGQKHADTK